MLFAIAGGVKLAAASPVATSAGGFDVPSRTSKLVAPVLLHAIAAVVLTPVAPVGGVAENGVAGGSPTTTLSKLEVLRIVVS